MREPGPTACKQGSAERCTIGSVTCRREFGISRGKHKFVSARDIAAWFDEFYTIRFGNYTVDLEYLHETECVPCVKR